MNIKLFGSADCAGCVVVKQLLTVNGVAFEYFDVMHHADMETASKYGIRGIPTVVVERDGVEHFFTGSTKPTVDSLLLHIGV